MGLNIGRVDALLQSSQGHESIKRPAIEQVPAGMTRNQTADRAFAGATRSVDRDNGNGSHRRDTQPLTESCRPAARAVSTNAGKDVATLATSRISMGAWARRLATAK